MPFLTEKLSPERYQEEMKALIQITRPAAILTYPEFLPVVTGALEAGDSVRVILSTASVQPVAEPDLPSLKGQARKAEDIVLLQHSSGTTGLQKGVALSHQAVIRQLEAYAKKIHLTSQDVIVSWLPLYHDMGLIAGFVMPVLNRVPLVLMSPFDWVRSPLPVDAGHFSLPRNPGLAAQFCLQFLRSKDPIPRPGRSRPFLMAGCD